MGKHIVAIALIFLIIAVATPVSNAQYNVCRGCHPIYTTAIQTKQHANTDVCLICHRGPYDTSTHISPISGSGYIGYIVNKTTCVQPQCHSTTSGFAQRPVDVSHGSMFRPPGADCTQCHFANNTQTFPLDPTLFVHDHNFTVEYNFYNYNLSGIPLSSNGGVGKGMFPDYTCTLTCHAGRFSVEKEVMGWNLSAHARSRHGTFDSRNACAQCKSPPNFNGNASDTSPIAAPDWQGIQCRVCHNLHNDTYSGIPGSPAFPLAFYNSTLSAPGPAVYEKVTDPTDLCEKCHIPGDKRHDSKYAGTHKDTVGFDCGDCHANSTLNNLTHTFVVRNSTTGVEGCDVCHNITDHIWEFTSIHINDVWCEACHDQTFVRNATSFSVSDDNNYGIYKDTATGMWATYKAPDGIPVTWPLHNITRNVNCNKCHNATSPFNGTIAPGLTCADCHPAYASAVNGSMHNQTRNPAAPNCTGCHAGYLPVFGHTSGKRGFTVNESNTCRNSGCHEQNVSGFFERHSGSSDCTQCHFAANTSRPFSLNASLLTHEHNLTVVHNFYEYNVSGMPLRINNGTGVGMFPYYTCTLATCHNHAYNATTGAEGLIETVAPYWLESKHARSLEWPNANDNKNNCAKCKSPPNYNDSLNGTNPNISAADWQGIQCRVCHNLHDRRFPNNTGPRDFPIAFYNSTLSSRAGYAVYQAVHNTTELCEKCHTGATHDSKFAGTHKDAVNFTCISCHKNNTFNDQSHLFEVKNTTSGVTGCDVCHNIADHTFQFTAQHIDKVTCEACHDKTVARNASGYAVNSSDEKVKNVSVVYGLYLDPATGMVSSYKDSHGAPATWPLHNISRDVKCDKCHGTLSKVTGLLAPTFGAIGCAECHSSYSSAVNNSMHNRTRNPGAPNCTMCHTGYDVRHNGYVGYIVNESNTCRNSGCHEQNVSGFFERHSGSSDCTQCHFAANINRPFSLNASLFTHEHNLTVVHNFYEYNISGLPLRINNGTGVGMFPYYTCTLATCHAHDYNATSGEEGLIERVAPSWLESKHARSLEWPNANDNKNNCAKCKSPPNYNDSLNGTNPNISPADWQGIQCRVCHNLHDRRFPNNTGPRGFPIAFYNSTLSSRAGHAVYEQVHNATELCEKCHLGGDHDSKFAGTHKDTVGLDCADCHVNTTFNNASHLFEVKNTTSGVTSCEVCHNIANHTFQFTSLHINKVTCIACHDQTFVSRNATNYSVSSDNRYGLYKDPATNKWTTYQLRRGATQPSTWPLHNISKSVTCTKCHGARSLYIAGGIAPGFGGDLTYIFQVTDPLVSGYNLVAIRLLPDPAISAKNLLYPSSGGIRGVTKVMRWNSSGQSWDSYMYDGSFYVGNVGNFPLDGYKAYFIMGNSSTAGQTYTFSGIR